MLISYSSTDEYTIPDVLPSTSFNVPVLTNYLNNQSVSYHIASNYREIPLRIPGQSIESWSWTLCPPYAYIYLQTPIEGAILQIDLEEPHTQKIYRVELPQNNHSTLYLFSTSQYGLLGIATHIIPCEIYQLSFTEDTVKGELFHRFPYKFSHFYIDGDTLFALGNLTQNIGISSLVIFDLSKKRIRGICPDFGHFDFLRYNDRLLMVENGRLYKWYDNHEIVARYSTDYYEEEEILSEVFPDFSKDCGAKLFCRGDSELFLTTLNGIWRIKDNTVIERRMLSQDLFATSNCVYGLSCNDHAWENQLREIRLLIWPQFPSHK